MESQLNIWLRYVILANGFIVLLYLFFKLVLAGETRLQWNRIILLGGLLVAVLIPLVPKNWIGFMNLPVLDLSSLSFFNRAGGGVIPLEEVVVRPASHTGPEWLRIMGILYLSGVGIMILSVLVQWSKLITWKFRYPDQRHNGQRITVLPQKIQPFSFLRRIYYPKPFNPDHPTTHLVLEHESVHIQQWHTLDLVVVELVRILFFYNPFIHLIKKEIQLTHEYLADRINGAEDQYTYTLSLFSSQFEVPYLALVHPFSKNSSLKRRFKMLLKNKHNQGNLWRYLLILPLFAGFILAGSCTKNEGAIAVPDENSNQPELKTAGVASSEVFFRVEEMPTFQEGDLNDFRNWVQANAKYPPIAIQNGIAGTVYVSFQVNKEGAVDQVKIVRGVDPSLDNEVMRILSKAPKWTPGKQRGQKVRVSMAIPVKFVLQ